MATIHMTLISQTALLRTGSCVTRMRFLLEIWPCLLTAAEGKVARRLSNVCNSLPFFEDLESPSQSFQTQEIISVGRDINLVKHNVRGPLGLHIALFLAYDLLLWSLKQAKKSLVSYRIYFFSAIITQECYMCYNHSKQKTTVFHGRTLKSTISKRWSTKKSWIPPVFANSALLEHR